MSRVRVHVSIPTTGTVCAPVAAAWDRWQLDQRFEVVRVYHEGVPLEHNLAWLARDFLADAECDYWVVCDDDNHPERNPLDLCLLGLDFVGLPTPVFKPAKAGGPDYCPIYWNAMIACPVPGAIDTFLPANPQPGLMEVSAHGGGCFVMSRAACQALVDGYGKEAFSRTWDENGMVIRGNDFSMTMRLRELGFKIYTHWDYMQSHYKRVDLKLVHESYLRFFRAHPEIIVGKTETVAGTVT